MINANEDNVLALVGVILGEARREWIAGRLASMIPVAMMRDEQDRAGGVSRGQLAAAMNILLFVDLLDRVPSGAAYVEDVRKSGRKVCFDHGAIRTICLADGDTGALPRGELAFRRILEPLGYEDVAIYPLPALRMTGRAYRHRDYPETIPQFFVSELHVDAFDAEFAATAVRVFGGSRDPLDAHSMKVLNCFAADKAVSFEDAVRALPTIVGAFDRHHDEPAITDYDILKRSSKEAAWIATEGNAFNHATDRVADVVALADEQKAMGRPVKEKVEFSRSGRVRQTALRAEMIERAFVTADGGEQRIMVPGSFYEFISRDVDPQTGALDLSFDSDNATGIFHMTQGA